MENWMCQMCFPDAKELGIIAPRYSLIFNGGKYHILGGQGHKDEEILTFEDSPWSDPDPECLEILSPQLEELAYRWLKEVGKLENRWKIRIESGHALCLSCEKAGWVCGSVVSWIFNRAGQLIENASVGEVL